jgi:replication-associated recombination protein RarA
MAHYQTKHHGFNDDELISALQKCIRRGMEQEAMYFALELAEEGKTGFSVLLSRLRVIMYEDVGLAGPAVVLQTSKALDDMEIMHEKKRGEWSMVLSYVILLLCRAMRSRIADHFLIVMKEKWKNDAVHVDIPDFALDMHTSKGNLVGRTKGSLVGINHFITEGEKLQHEHPTIKDSYHEQVIQLWKKRIG